MQKVVWYTTCRHGVQEAHKKTAWRTMVHTGTLGHRQPGLTISMAHTLMYVSYAGVVFWYINGDIYIMWLV